MMPVEEVHLSFITREDLRRVVEEDAQWPVAAMSLAPGGKDQRTDASAMPSLRLAPTAVVDLEVPVPPPASTGTRLRFALGIDEPGYTREEGGRVTVTIEPDVGPAFSAELPFGGDVPRAQRIWTRAELPLEGVRRLRLAVRSSDPGAKGLAVGIASLEVFSEREVARGRATAKRPNLILILVDTLRADRLGAYGYTRPTSPRLDAFAAGGLLFERASSSRPWLAIAAPRLSVARASRAWPGGRVRRKISTVRRNCSSASAQRCRMK
jgi:hypothetical protein